MMGLMYPIKVLNELHKLILYEILLVTLFSLLFTPFYAPQLDHHPLKHELTKYKTKALHSKPTKAFKS